MPSNLLTHKASLVGMIALLLLTYTPLNAQERQLSIAEKAVEELTCQTVFYRAKGRNKRQSTEQINAIVLQQAGRILPARGTNELEAVYSELMSRVDLVYFVDTRQLKDFVYRCQTAGRI